MPNFLLQYIIGKRNYEAAWTINTVISKISSFFGSANIKNEDTSPKTNEHVYDYIFCKNCETWLGKIEGEAAVFLNDKARNKKFEQQFIIQQDNEIVIKTTKKYNPGIIHLCLFSVGYRILLKYRFDFGVDLIAPAIVESIRQFICNNAKYSIAELRNIFLNLPYSYSLVTNDKLDFGDSLFGYSYYKPTNPEVFLLGRYILLLHLNNLDLDNLDTLDNKIVSRKYQNNAGDLLSLISITDGMWKSFTDDYVAQVAKIHIENMIKNLSTLKGISLQLAKTLLFTKANELQSQFSDLEFSIALEQAYERLK